ncbi:hypothetical protein AAG906_024621 [Vitis piasezkii]
MKRKKRVEDTVDVASYWYFAENKSSVGEGASLIDDCGNLGKKIEHSYVLQYGVGIASAVRFHDGWSSLEFRGNDNSLEEILWKIEKAKLQVVNENAGKYSSINKLMLVPCNASTSSARNPTSPSNGNRMPVGSLYAASQHVSDCNMGDLGMPETAASSHGEAIPVPDIIESTEQHQTEEVLIHNQVAKEELNNFHGVKVDPTEKPLPCKFVHATYSAWSLPPLSDLYMMSSASMLHVEHPQYQFS